jgi:hypothetical protein
MLVMPAIIPCVYTDTSNFSFHERKTYLLNTNQLQQYVSLFLGIGVRLEPTEGKCVSNYASNSVMKT